VLALAGLGVAIGYLRGFRAALLPRRATKSSPAQRARYSLVFTFQEPSLLLALIGLLTAATILLGLFPAVLIQPVQILAGGISIPIQ
jgi:hypothetical protein